MEIKKAQKIMDKIIRCKHLKTEFILDSNFVQSESMDRIIKKNEKKLLTAMSVVD